MAGSLFPEVINMEMTQAAETATSETNGNSFKFDFAAGDFVLVDGKTVQVSGVERIKVYAEKVIRTEKFRFKIYAKNGEDEYGISIEDLIIGKNWPVSAIESELKREITEAMLKDSEITGVEGFEIIRNGSAVQINFELKHIYGTSQIGVVI